MAVQKYGDSHPTDLGEIAAPQPPMPVATVVDNSLAASAKAKVLARYEMALHRPRSEAQARLDMLRHCNRSRFAEVALYRKPIGGRKHLEGLSIRFVEQALRCWRNVEITTACVKDTIAQRVIEVSVTDIELNTGYAAQITVVKSVERRNGNGREVLSQRRNSYGDLVFVVRATDDEMANKEQSAVSKAIRNLGLRLLPADLLEDATDAIHATRAAKDKQDPAKAAKRCADAFASLGVAASDLERYMGKAVEAFSAREIDALRKTAIAIKDGEATWDSFVASGDQ